MNNISKEQVLALLKGTMEIHLSYNGTSWGRMIDYDAAKLFKSDIGKQIFSSEPGILEFLTIFNERWGITEVEIKDIANNIMWKKEYMSQIKFDDDASRKKYISELYRIGELKENKTSQEASQNEEESKEEIEKKLHFQKLYKENIILMDTFKKLDTNTKMSIKAKLYDEFCKRDYFHTAKLNDTEYANRLMDIFEELAKNKDKTEKVEIPLDFEDVASFIFKYFKENEGSIYDLKNQISEMFNKEYEDSIKNVNASSEISIKSLLHNRNMKLIEKEYASSKISEIESLPSSILSQDKYGAIYLTEQASKDRAKFNCVTEDANLNAIKEQIKLLNLAIKTRTLDVFGKFQSQSEYEDMIENYERLFENATSNSKFAHIQYSDTIKNIDNNKNNFSDLLKDKVNKDAFSYDNKTNTKPRDINSQEI